MIAGRENMRQVASILLFALLLMELWSWAFEIHPIRDRITFGATKAYDYMSSSTFVGGYISENTTWTLKGSPYIVVEDVVVEPNISLTIEPGVTIRFRSGKNLVIDGFLYAIGNSTHRILFTSDSKYPNPGDWGAIMLRRSESKHLMEWVIVEYADKGIHIKFGLVTIKNSIFRWNNIGLYASDAGNIKAQETLIINNVLSGVHTDWFDCSIYLDKVKVLYNGVGLDTYRGHFDMNNSIIAKNKGYGIYLPCGFGGFRNIYIYNSTISENLGYGIYAQSWCWQPTYIIGCTITDNTLSGIYREAGQWGVYIYNCTISRNKDSGIRGLISGASYNNIFKNSPYDFKNEESGDVNATYNWWGTINETEIRSHIYDYYDNYNLGRIIFRPFLSEPVKVPDNIAPLIDKPTQSPSPTEVKSYDNVKVMVNITDYESGVKNVTLWYTLFNGTLWVYTSMLYNESLGLYVATIPSQPAKTYVKYKIVSTDLAGNIAIEDNLGEFYTYQVQTAYILEITTTTGGTTDPQPGAYTFLYGSRVNVTAFPKAGYSFSYWLLDGNIRTENPISVLMDSNHTLHAVFTQITYQLSITSTTGGTTNPAPGIYTYVNGTHVVITAVPNNGFSFDYWLLDGVKTTQNPITIIMNANHTLEAHFIDNIPPEISEPWQDPPANNVQPLQNVTVWVNVTDYGTGIKNVTLWYSINNGTTWTIINMTELPIPSGMWITYKATIRGYENCTWITYKIVAYDNAGNNATKDNNGYGYQYHVIPEFGSTTILSLFMLTTLIATVLLKKKIKPKSQLH
jgi:hypothetical protein